MFSRLKATLRHIAARYLGLRVSRILPYREALKRDYPDVDPWILVIVERLQGMHMTSPERITALCKSVEAIVAADIPGDFVECGVWRGGSMMAVALTLQHLGRHDRRLVLFDTFEGMTPPSAADRDLTGATAARLLQETSGDKSVQIWAYATLPEVQANMRSTGYPEAMIGYVQGKVEDTLPARAPERIALLRLDTDWYESTIHELRTLWSRLAIGGILIVDDYGHWKGSRRAVDEFFVATPGAPLLSRIDYSGRLAVKTR